MIGNSIARDILEHVGGIENIVELENCMTRIRILVKDPAKVDRKLLGEMAGVLSVVGAPEEPQIVLGPGVADTVGGELKKVKGLNYSEMDGNKGALMTKRSATGVMAFIAKVFAPLIPLLAGSGLLFGIRQIFVAIFNMTAFPLFNPATVDNGGSVFMGVMTVLCSTFFTYLNISVATQAARVKGGNIFLGLVAGGIITNLGGLAGTSMGLLGLNFVNNRGGTIAALAAGALIATVEQWIKKRCPDALKIHVPALGSIVVVGLVTMFALQPVAGFVTDIMTKTILWLFENAGPFGGAVISFGFLPLVMTGMHNGISPIHLSLIQEIGYSPLSKFTSMGGAGQIGACLALLFKYRKYKALQGAVKGGMPAAVLGIGEPLIFGVSLPMGRVFFTACAGSAVGGLVAGFFPGAGAVTTNVSGILGLLTATRPGVYALSYCAAIVAGFVITWFVGAKEDNLRTFGVES